MRALPYSGRRGGASQPAPRTGGRIPAASRTRVVKPNSSNGKGEDVAQTKIIAIVLVVLGLGLGFWGYKESGGFGSAVSRTFTGSDTNRVMTFYIGGAVSLVVGLYLLMKK